MHYLNEQNLLLFLAQVLVLLTVAKILGELCKRRGMPALAGEILTGIVLGPTIFGRVFPSLEAQLFPRDLIQQNMLETVSWFGVLFLLLSTGFEVNISTVWKQGKVCLTIGFICVLIPFLIGCAVFWWFPPDLWGENANRETFTLFLATAAAVSAITVIAKVLYDLDILKSDFGLMALSSAVVNDVLGWMTFTLVLGLAATHDQTREVFRVLFEIILFGIVCLTVGSKVVGAITRRLQQSSMPQPATTLTFICCLGLLCGAITQWTGIHAILGFFLAGIMAGNTPEISESTREVISQMIHAIFVPIFFATIGIKIDFLEHFDLFLVVIITTVAIGGKFVGAWAGGRIAGMSKPDSLSLGIAFIPGGAMEIILGMLALELKLIPENVFVALVFAALSSSVLVGPVLAWSIRRRESVNVGGLLLPGAINLHLEGVTRWKVIPELCAKVAAQMGGALDRQELVTAVLEREEIMGTGLEKGVAVPHARLKQLERPLVAFGRSKRGIDWDARDGLATHFVFLILTPEKEEGMQVQILASIARVMTQGDIPGKLMTAKSDKEVFELLNQALDIEPRVRREEPA